MPSFVSIGMSAAGHFAAIGANLRPLLERSGHKALARHDELWRC
jgi:hypothetical protein